MFVGSNKFQISSLKHANFSSSCQERLDCKKVWQEGSNGCLPSSWKYCETVPASVPGSREKVLVKFLQAKPFDFSWQKIRKWVSGHISSLFCFSTAENNSCLYEHEYQSIFVVFSSSQIVQCLQSSHFKPMFSSGCEWLCRVCSRLVFITLPNKNSSTFINRKVKGHFHF